MTTQTLAVIRQQNLEMIVDLVANAMANSNSKQAYRGAMRRFLDWWDQAGRPQICKATIQSYRDELQSQGLSPSTVNQALSAVKKLIREAKDNRLLPDPYLAATVELVKGIKARGQRLGNWLSKAQAQRLLNAPNPVTLKGKRDRAILAVLLFAGLRRSEVASLTFEHLQRRYGQWQILDLTGKHGRTRTVTIPHDVKEAIDEWTTAAGISHGPLFRAMRRGDRINGAAMTPQAVYNLVKEHGAACGLNIAPHDLRRTFATLANRGGVEMKQLQLALGHAAQQTTERYLNVDQDLENPLGAVLGLCL